MAFVHGEGEHIGPYPSCMDAYDSNDDGVVDNDDMVNLFWHIMYPASEQSVIPAPSSLGEDPTPDDLGCESGNAVSPVAEHGTTLTIAPCTLLPGESSVITQLLLTTNQVIDMFKVELTVEGVPRASLDTPFGFEPEGIPPVHRYAHIAADGRTIGVMPAYIRSPRSGTFALIGPCQNAVVHYVEISFPARPPAGTYCLVLSDGRVGLVGDLAAHTVDTVSSVLVVQPTYYADYRLTGPASVTPDTQTVTVALEAKCGWQVTSLDAAIDFSESVLDLQSVDKTLLVGGGPPSVFETTIGPPTSQTVVNDPSEGYAALHIELADPAAWEADAWHEVAKLNFTFRRPPVELYGRTSLNLRNVGPEGQFVNKTRVRSGGEDLAAVTRIAAPKFPIGLPGPLPPVVSKLEDVRATYRLSDGGGSPGDSGIPIYLFIESNTALVGFGAAFVYDKSVLEIESITSLVHACGEEPDFVLAGVGTLSDPPDAPHGAGIGVIMDLPVPGGTGFLPTYFPAPDEPAACARFRILPDAREGAEAQITFVDEFFPEDGQPCTNVVVAGEAGATPEFETGEVAVTSFKNGRVLVLGEVTPFLRGDANADFYLNIADAVTVLSFLFARGTALPCPDAADSNDDGAIDIADPITTLYTLFTARKEIRQPYPGMGRDPTPDSLGPCSY